VSDRIIDVLLAQADLLKENLSRFFLIITDPQGFVRTINFDDQAQIIGASIFAALMSLANLVILLPVYRLNQVQASSESYVIIDTVTTYLGWFLYGTTFHYCARVIGGSGKYAASIGTWMFLTAFNPLCTIVLLPVAAMLQPALMKQPDIWSPGFQLHLLAQSPGIAVSYVGGMLIYIWYMISLSRAYGVVHGLSSVRSAAATLLGLLGMGLVIQFVTMPTQEILWLAYKSIVPQSS